MSESDWLTGTDLALMLAYVGEQVSQRKLRLFACACCRNLWPNMGQRSQIAVEVGERYADGRATSAERNAAEHQARAAAVAAGWTATKTAARVAIQAISWSLSPEMLAEAVKAAARTTGSAREEPTHVTILRDIMGNPWRPASFRPDILCWRDGTVVKLARCIYDERAFDRMPILADALEDASCEDASILDHCRQSTHHVRGCWVLDYVLGLS